MDLNNVFFSGFRGLREESKSAAPNRGSTILIGACYFFLCSKFMLIEQKEDFQESRAKQIEGDHFPAER